MNKILKILSLTFLLISAPAAAEGEKVVLAMGDSLMAGYNLPQGRGFPGQLEDWLHEQGIAATVVNAGVSGDTTAGGLARLDWTLAGVNGGKPDLLIIEFGANDMLRGIEPGVTRENLDAILKDVTERGLTVVLMGMRAAPNMGPDFEKAFNAIYPELAEKYGVELYPFYLDGVAAERGLNLEDGIHPNEQGVAVMVSKAGPMILKLLGH